MVSGYFLLFAFIAFVAGGIYKLGGIDAILDMIFRPDPDTSKCKVSWLNAPGVGSNERMKRASISEVRRPRSSGDLELIYFDVELRNEEHVQIRNDRLIPMSPECLKFGSWRAFSGRDVEEQQEAINRKDLHISSVEKELRKVTILKVYDYLNDVGAEQQRFMKMMRPATIVVGSGGRSSGTIVTGGEGGGE